MTNIEVKANEKLFNRWRQLGMMISLSKSIVQNDMIISQEMYKENKKFWIDNQRELDDLQACTQLWIEYNEEC